MSRQFQFAHSNFNLLMAVSFCSRQFQFAHSSFNFAHGSFNFAHSSFNLLTAVSICSRQFQFRSLWGYSGFQLTLVTSVVRYACQIGSKCRKIVFIYSNTIYMSELQYIYMSKLQYILLNCNIYVHSWQNICPSRCMGFRFIMPRFNVIFDIYILRVQLRHIYRHANLYKWVDPYPAKDESEAAPRNNMAATEEDRIQHIAREIVSLELRKTGPGSSIQQDSSNNSAIPPFNFVGTFHDVNEELSSRFNFPSSAASAAFPANSHASGQIACSFNPAANYAAGSVKDDRVVREGFLIRRWILYSSQ